MFLQELLTTNITTPKYFNLAHLTAGIQLTIHCQIHLPLLNASNKRSELSSLRVGITEETTIPIPTPSSRRKYYGTGRLMLISVIIVEGGFHGGVQTIAHVMVCVTQRLLEWSFAWMYQSLGAVTGAWAACKKLPGKQFLWRFINCKWNQSTICRLTWNNILKCKTGPTTGISTPTRISYLGLFRVWYPQ